MAEQKKQKISLIPISTIFTLISVGLFITKTVNSFIGKAQQEGASDLTKFVVLPLLVIFSICFVVLVVVNIRDARALKKSAKDVKYAMKTTKTASAILEAFVEVINITIAIVMAYDTYAGVEIKWYDFKYYFTMIILIYTLFTTVFFIVLKSMKLMKGARKRKQAEIKAQEKEIKAQEKEEKAEERKRVINETIESKKKLLQDKLMQEKESMPQKDQSHKPIKLSKK